jgi:hypothetical protein
VGKVTEMVNNNLAEFLYVQGVPYSGFVVSKDIFLSLIKIEKREKKGLFKVDAEYTDYLVDHEEDTFDKFEEELNNGN